MPRLAKKKLAALLARGDLATTTTERGRALEDYICELLGHIPGISILGRNALNAFATEELDVAFWNDRHPAGLDFLPRVVLVECKNWSSPVGSAELSYFGTRMQQRGCDYGILVAAKGITGDPTQLTAAQFILAGQLAQKRWIIVVSRADLEALSTTTEFCTLLKRKLCQLVVNGTA